MEPKPIKHDGDPPNRTRRRSMRVLLSGILLLGVLLMLLPTVVANTRLRNTVINLVLADPQMHAAAGGASLGWFSPMHVRELRVARHDKNLQIKIAELYLQRSWLHTWLGLPEIGQISLEKPQIEVVVSEALLAEPPNQHDRSDLTFSARVFDGALQLLLPGESKPVLALDNVDLNVWLDRDTAGRVLRIEPMVILDRATLSPELCDRGLQLVAPILADAARVEGEVSLELIDFELPIDADSPEDRRRRTRIQGIAQLHQVTTGLKNPLLREISELVSRFFELSAPETLRVADNTVVTFSVENDRVFHDGLTFLLPEVSPDFVWRTSGSVGLDDSLDLTVQGNLPLTLLGDGPLLRRLTEQPLQLRITGTLDDPQLELPPDQNWFKQAAELVLSEALPDNVPGLSRGVLDVVGDVMRERLENAPPRETPLLDRIRQRVQSRRESAADPPPGDVLPQRRGLFRRRGRG